MAPANAIFGLSKCEKVKKQIRNEMAIGDVLFKSYRKVANNLQPKKDSETYGQHFEKYKGALSSLKLVLDSDVKAWSYAQNSVKCFSVEQNSAIRSALGTYKKSNSEITKLISKTDYFSQIDLNNVYISRFKNDELFFK